jgi:uncharacterized membrane protein HdeD (DUF308 family)
MVIVGGVLLVGAVAGFVIVPEHKPEFTCLAQLLNGAICTSSVTSGWSRTAYDAARIGTWALLIAGVLLVAVGLVNFARPSHASGTNR